MKTFHADQLTVQIYETRDAMGRAAAADIRACILRLLAQKPTIRMIFAAAPSQNETLAALASYDDIDWTRIHAFHMDEYIGLPEAYRDRSFGHYLMQHIFGRAPFRSVNLIDCTAQNPDAECARYAALLAESPIDIVVMGIGENGHIAFNDPWVADFADSRAVKVVQLDAVCRQQQVNDGCFPAIDCVPTHAMTLTCPTLAAAAYQFCVVPGATKAAAVRRTVCGAIGAECPATILRQLPNAALYLDGDSAAQL